MTICLFGGSFDPVHNGHIHFAELIIDTFQLDAFYFIPTHFSPYKSETKFASDEHRLNMLNIACKAIPLARVSDIEIERKGLSYTIDTLKTFRERYPDDQLFFVIGDDHLAGLKNWKAYPEHFDYCDFIVLPRHIENTKIEINKHPYKDQFHLLEVETLNLSSTEIRKTIKDHKSILSYVPQEINDYISSNKLYR